MMTNLEKVARIRLVADGLRRIQEFESARYLDEYAAIVPVEQPKDGVISVMDALRAIANYGSNANLGKTAEWMKCIARTALTANLSQPQPVAQGEAVVVTLAEAERVAHHAYVAGKRGYTFTGFVDELRSAATPTIPPGHRVVPVDDTKDAARWKALVRGLRNGFPGTGHGKRIKVIEVCPMYGDETMVTDIAGFIDAASPSAGGV